MNEIWARYNCIDAAVTYKVWEEIEPDLKSQDQDNLYKATMALYDAIIFMQTIGLKVDREALKRERGRIEAAITAAEEALYEICLFDLNVNSPKQCKQYFYGILGHQPYLSGKGKITTDDKAMARLVRKGVKEAKYVQTIRGLKKLLGTYLEVITDTDGRIRSSFNPRGTSTGRLSSSQTIFATGLNFQNLDPRFKGFIIADEGRFFFSLDKAQAEWVVTAYACGDPKMIAAVESGENIHVVTANAMTGIPKDIIEKEYKIIGKQTDADLILELRHKYIPEIFDSNYNFLPRTMSVYQCGKKSNHGCNYIEGYRMYALINEIMEKEAKLHIDTYRNMYINLPLWWERVERQLSKNRTVENCFGYKRRFMGEWGKDLLKQAVAYIPQSTSVWVVNHAMTAIYNDNSDIFNDLWLHAQVHDELLFSYPIDRWYQAANVIYKCIDYITPHLSYEGRGFNIKTDLSIGLNWGEQNKDNLRGMKKIEALGLITDLAPIIEAEYAKMF